MPSPDPLFTDLTTGLPIDDRLDPQALTLLREVAAAGPPPGDIDRRRAGFTALFQRLSGPAEPIAERRDLSIDGPSGPLTLRLYRPAAGLLPALLYTHGGGFNKGDLESHDAALRRLANRAGCAILAVDYRRTPEFRYPTQADEAYAALRWLAEHAGDYGLDPARIAVGGDSVGGNLAAVTALRARAQGGPRLRYQLLLYPVTDVTLSSPSWRAFAEGPWLTRTEEHHGFHELYLPAWADPRAAFVSPLFADDLAGLPPAFVADGEFDPYRDEGQQYAQRLRAVGVAVAAKVYPGMIHDFVLMAGALDGARLLIDEAAAALRAAFEHGDGRGAS